MSDIEERLRVVEQKTTTLESEMKSIHTKLDNIRDGLKGEFTRFRKSFNTRMDKNESKVDKLEAYAFRLIGGLGVIAFLVEKVLFA